MACCIMKCVLLFLLNVLCFGQNNFTITRPSKGNYLDIFKVPPWNCTVDGSYCKSYHKEAYYSGESCKCSCPHSASTFGFFGSSWMCIGNQKLRSQSGCSIKFALEQDSYPFKVFKDNGFQNSNVQFKGDKCKIDYTKSKFFKCNDTWRQLSITPDYNKISIAGLSKVDKSKDYKYYISIEKSTALKGAFISLYFDCVSSCLLFKIAGEITCEAGGEKSVTTTKKPNVPATTGISTTKVSQLTTKDATSSTSRSSSGVVAAVVIVVLLVIIIALIIAYVLWKRKRGERVWMVEKYLNIVAKLKRPTSKAPSQQHDEEEKQTDGSNIYEEIPDITFVQERTTAPDKEISFSLNNSKSIPRERQQGISMRNGRRSITDLEGYAVPVELNGKLQFHRNPSKDKYDYALPDTELPQYNVLQEPYAQVEDGNTYSNANEEDYDVPEGDLSDNIVLGKTKQETGTTEDNEIKKTSEGEYRHSGLVEEGDASGPNSANEITSKKARRRPPSPPRKI